MALPIALIGPIVSIGMNLIDRFFPDKEAAAKAKRELLRMEKEGEIHRLAQQVDINMEEARHESIFVSGWRPFIGWVCGIIFAYHGIALPIIKYIAIFSGFDVNTLPEFDIAMFSTVLMGMLGLGGLRTYEKFKGVNHNRRGKPKYGPDSENYTS